MSIIEIEDIRKPETSQNWINEKLFLGFTVKEYVKRLFTPFNMFAGLIVLIGAIFILERFIFGLDKITEASNEQPWGLLLGVGLFTGVPFSASGFVVGTAVYIFGLKKYRPVVKNAILLGFLGYLFAVVFLMIDLGRPWRIYYPMVISFGPASVMFLVAWHVSLYLTVQAFEFSPSAFDWLGLKKIRKWVLGMTIALTIAGIMLSTLHQSALGAMFLLAPGKLHPLWYTSYLPWLHLITAIAGGLVFVVVVSKLVLVFMKDRVEPSYRDNLDNITLGIGKATSFILFTYVGLRLSSIAYENAWGYINTPFGHWFLLEFMLFAALPFMFYYGVKIRNVGLVQFSALLTMVAIIINRLNISIIAFNWKLPGHELFFWKEGIVVLSVLTIEILVYRWIVNRMPVLSDETHV
ncbi:MAG: polysulfide reductase NrfD [Candidatus Methanoperedenaceae archaeon]|nr:polysulfide reductase NrfD [Candidatus Methanoperedenaceae archaeon]